MVLDSQLRVKLVEMPIVELLAIVDNDNLWYSESTYYGLSDEVTYVVLGYHRQGLGFNPFCKVVDNHYKEFPLSFC